MDENAPARLADRLDAALPQMQCRRCGYDACRPYAEAIARGDAINKCPPGGTATVAALAALTGRTALALDPAHGLQGPLTVARVDEAWCIGCTLCIKACPTDAIIGSNKLMHTVIEPYCTGCELCLPVCPVDCITLENVTDTATGWAAWPQALADLARSRYEFHTYRQKRDEEENQQRLEEKASAKLADLAGHSMHTDPVVLEQKRAVIEAALARARARRGPGSAPS